MPDLVCISRGNFLTRSIVLQFAVKAPLWACSKLAALVELLSALTALTTARWFFSFSFSGYWSSIACVHQVLSSERDRCSDNNSWRAYFQCMINICCLLYRSQFLFSFHFVQGQILTLWRIHCNWHELLVFNFSSSIRSGVWKRFIVGLGIRSSGAVSVFVVFSEGLWTTLHTFSFPYSACSVLLSAMLVWFCNLLLSVVWFLQIWNGFQFMEFLFSQHRLVPCWGSLHSLMWSYGNWENLCVPNFLLALRDHMDAWEHSNCRRIWTRFGFQFSATNGGTSEFIPCNLWITLAVTTSRNVISLSSVVGSSVVNIFRGTNVVSNDRRSRLFDSSGSFQFVFLMVWAVRKMRSVNPKLCVFLSLLTSRVPHDTVVGVISILVPRFPFHQRS